MEWREDRIGSAARGENPTVLGETTAGYAVMGDVQFLPGYSVLLSRNPSATALAELPRAERVQYLADVDLLATAVERACRAHDPAFRRMNIEILGNTDAFVHAHIWPRYEWEPADIIHKPVWLYDSSHWSDPAHALDARHDALRAAIAAELAELLAAEV
ncbi:HIT family protein [Microbacterium sp. NPDC057650]|uniref:HIT family protein n=1 Tax=unclassified Microbacterium TaxID=2609290 RepID=UPI0036734A93